MSKDKISTLIDNVIGKTGALKTPAYWMSSILHSLNDFILSVKNSLGNLSIKVSKLTSEMDSKIVDIDTKINKLDYSVIKTVDLDSTKTSVTLQSNKFYKIAPSKELSVYLSTANRKDVLNEYAIQITCSGKSVTLPSYIVWANGIAPNFESGVTYVISIINNQAVFAQFDS